MKHYTIILVVLLVCNGCRTNAKTDRNGVVRLHELILPELKLEKATLRQGLDTVRQAWNRKYPKESFPVVLLESLEVQSGAGLRSTLTLTNIPALTAVTYLANAHAMTVRYGLDLVVLRPVLACDEGEWTTVMLRASERVIAALELSTKADGDDEANRAIRERLESYGLRFEAGFDVRWFGGSKQLYIRNTPEEVQRAKGLFMLLDAGCTIQIATGTNSPIG